MKYCFGGALMLVGGLFGGMCQAAENMMFYGALVEPPACTINDGGNIDVDFGSQVGSKKIDGTNYLTTLVYKVTCAPNSKDSDMMLEVTGTSVDYDAAAVGTDVKDLAIQIKYNGLPFELGKPIAITRIGQPELQVVPVKRPGATLKEGPFTATATLRVVYQ